MWSCVRIAQEMLFVQTEHFCNGAVLAKVLSQGQDSLVTAIQSVVTDAAGCNVDTGASEPSRCFDHPSVKLRHPVRRRVARDSGSVAFRALSGDTVAETTMDGKSLSTGRLSLKA
jgi:hypothetical protein